MTKRLTVSVPDDLFKKMEAREKDMDVSGIFRKAIQKEIDKTANTARCNDMICVCDPLEKENGIYYDEVMSPFFGKERK